MYPIDLILGWRAGVRSNLVENVELDSTLGLIHVEPASGMNSRVGGPRQFLQPLRTVFRIWISNPYPGHRDIVR
eukprot:2848810-Pyramimonas_sp.AAC.1